MSRISNLLSISISQNKWKIISTESEELVEQVRQAKLFRLFAIMKISALSKNLLMFFVKVTKS